MSSTTLNTFANKVVKSGQLFLLSADDEYLVVDSVEYAETDVMPIFSSKDAAAALCSDDWAEYQVAQIAVEDFFEQWLPELDKDGIMLGIDLDVELQGEEVEAFTFGKALADNEI
ncbi:DUF2750 domain-containing protein [Vibrio ulleungensis]|jgi:hypothetical protein|uniref:DUF2750 domain-containing protein n=1 Tax=Vibrio ulleungensis TaxID=2807619 RepID=A0ABS2HI39_9VIBR|nr:DUF2750 domain-containing protein [Vibrio ulleungensis]MBM7037198.1 DUF2750 domain-containing protein [Vibrio ulleungensis]